MALFLSTQCSWVGFKRKTICMKQKMLPLRSLNGERKIVDALEGDEAFIIVDWTMKFIAMKFREKQAEWFP